jgi:hypothetical protein
MHKQIKVTISPLGMPLIEAQGFAGTSCTNATKAIEGALGADLNAGVTVTEFKSEYYEQEQSLTETNDMHGGY